VHGGDPGPTIRIDLLRGGIPPFVRAEAPPPPPLTAAAHPTWLSYAALCAKQGESSAGRTETSSGTIAARCSCRSSSRSAAGAFLKKMSSPPISEDGNPFDTGQRDRCTLRNRGGAAAEVASPCAFVYNIIYQYYISVLYQYRKCIRIHSGTVSGTAGDAVGLCSQRMAGDAPCKHFYTRLCCATLHTHFALSLFVKLSLAIFIPVAPP
jgi:hypothetical protein